MNKKLIVTSLAASLLVLPAAHIAQAQRGGWGPGGRGDGGRGGGMRGGEMRPDSAKRRLTGLWNGVWRLEGSGAPLSKAQAKRVVAVVRPWTNKATMTEAQAGALQKSLNAVLTGQQRAVIGPEDDGPGGPGGPGRFRGPDGPGGGRPGPPNGRPPGPPGGGPDPAQMRAMQTTMNPFYPPTGYSRFKTLPERMQRNMIHRYQEARATLVMLSRKAA